MSRLLNTLSNAGKQIAVNASYTFIDPLTDPRWDAFVSEHAAGSVYHHSSWCDVLCSTYPMQSRYVAILDDGDNKDEARIIGALPCMLVSSPLTGVRLVSLPFCVQCDPLMSAEQVAGAVQFLREQEPRSKSIELRATNTLEGWNKETLAELGLHEHRDYVSHQLFIARNDHDLMQAFHPSSIRQKIRKAEKSALTVRGGSGETDLKAFYELVVASRAEQGLPPAPYKLMQNIYRIMKDRGRLHFPIVEHAGEIIAGALNIHDGRTIVGEYSAMNRNFRNMYPNHLIVWETIKEGREIDVKHLDFGRSSKTNESLIAFKDRWGAEQTELVYYSSKPCEEDTGPSLPKRALQFLNRRLPSSLLKLEGSLLYRHMS